MLTALHCTGGRLLGLRENEDHDPSQEFFGLSAVHSLNGLPQEVQAITLNFEGLGDLLFRFFGSFRRELLGCHSLFDRRIPGRHQDLGRSRGYRVGWCSLGHNGHLGGSTSLCSGRLSRNF